MPEEGFSILSPLAMAVQEITHPTEANQCEDQWDQGRQEGYHEGYHDGSAPSHHDTGSFSSGHDSGSGADSGSTGSSE